jgi:peroxiredoxin
MKIHKPTVYWLIPLLLIAWIWIFRVPPSAMPPAPIQAPKTGFQAPSFSLETIDGFTINLDDYRGQPVLINFWASWCPPCRAEMPDFQAAWEEYQDSNLIIIAVNATHQDSLADVQDFISQNGLDFPIPLDKNGQISAIYQIHSLPTTFFINQEGIITKALIGGPIPLSLLRVEVDSLIQDNTNASNN